MTPEELTRYIRKKLKKGYPAGELENQLLEKGYAKEAIDEAMNNPQHQWDVSSTRTNMIAVNSACIVFVAVAGIVSGMNLYVTGVVGFIAACVMYLIMFRQKTKRKNN